MKRVLRCQWSAWDACEGRAITNGQNQAVSVQHYENFPVASLLCPPALRPPVQAIYHFARTADDLADEGDATAPQRLSALARYRADLAAISAGALPSAEWKPVFAALSVQLKAHQLPRHLLEDLLDAFEQDVRNPSYPTRAELLDYCRRSANPIGRLLLHLYAVEEKVALQQSDAICSALQLINFWQDLSVDMPRGRCYVPAADLASHGLRPDQLAGGIDTAQSRTLVSDLCDWAQALMDEGRPLVHRLPGRMGWELRLVVQGGMRILEKIRKMDHAALSRRPTLGPLDVPVLLWRALRMGATT
jgi:hydroxysqualene synthase